MSARLFILRSRGGEEGPYAEEDVMDALAAGELSPTDWCRLEDQPHAQMLCEIFEHWQAAPSQKPDAASPGSMDASPGNQGRGHAKAADFCEESGKGMREDEEAGQPEMWDEAEDELPDETAGESEAVVYAGQPSVMGYGWSIMVAAAVLSAGYWLGQFGVPWVAGSLAATLALVVRVLLHRAARDYVVTTHRVVSTTGLLAKSRHEISLEDLSEIRLHRPGPLGWLGVGTVIFVPAAPEVEQVVFERVARSNRVISLVRHARVKSRRIDSW